MPCTSTQQTKCSIKTFLQTSKIREVFVLINGDYVQYVKPYIFLKVIGILELNCRSWQICFGLTFKMEKVKHNV